MRRNKKVITLIALAAIILIAAALSVYFNFFAKSEKSSPALVNPPDTSGNSVEAFGAVKPHSTHIISAGIKAGITRLKVREGQRIKSGDTLAELDLSDYQDHITSMDSEMEALKRDLELLHRNYEDDLRMLRDGSLPELKRLVNSLTDSEQALLKAKKALGLKQSLYAEGSIPKSELEDAETQADLKRNACRDASLSLESFKAAKRKDLSAISLEITAKEDKMAALEKESAALKQKLNSGYLQDNRIVFISNLGVVSKVNCSEGLSVNPDEAILEIMDISSLTVEAAVDEQFINMVQEGAQVVITPDADRSRLYAGKVTFLSSLAVTTNGETVIPVTITIDDADSFLIPGLNVSVKIDAN